MNANEREFIGIRPISPPILERDFLGMNFHQANALDSRLLCPLGALAFIRG
jgi:hypothetical protein